jgi:hypothetical protein
MQVSQFIERLFLLYPLRGNKEEQKFIIAEYEDCLSRFNAVDLKFIWGQVREGFTYRPSIAELVVLCRKEIKTGNSEVRTEKWPWEITAEKIKKMRDDYLDNFMKYNPTASQARLEGWENHLKQYVSNIAHIQAQVICGSANIGFSNYFGCQYDPEICTRRCNSIIGRAKGMTEILVFVSNESIEYFRTLASRENLAKRPEQEAA